MLGLKLVLRKKMELGGAPALQAQRQEDLCESEVRVASLAKFQANQSHIRRLCFNVNK